MGPSGSGKSSLLDILSGHEKSGKVKGVVEYFSRNQRISARQQDVDGLRVRLGHTTVEGIGYVYQDDQLLPSQTVLEALTFSAEARLPRDVSRDSVAARVQSTLVLLDLKHIASACA
jgi:ABC-type multidrug transport system ATPase subunit